MDIDNMTCTQMREEAQKRMAEGRPGWDGTFAPKLRFETPRVLKASLKADRYPLNVTDPVEPVPAPQTPAKPSPAIPAIPATPEPQKAPEPPIVTQTLQDPMSGLGQLLAGLIQPHLAQQKVDITELEARVNAEIATLGDRVQQKLDELRPITEIVAVDREGRIKNVLKGQHKRFKEFTTLALARKPGKQNLLLWGPAGTGKSYAARKLAELLGVKFYLQSCGPGTQEFHFWGHTDANGNYLPTPTWLAFQCGEEGAVLCIDEIDSSDPGVGLVLNSITHGDEACFPHPVGCLPRPKNLIIVATANTMNGADARYGARYEMDQALRSRFVPLFWGNDEAFEAELYPSVGDWRKYVQACREAIDDLKIPYVVCSRNICAGEDYLADGTLPRPRIEEICLWGDGILPPEKINQVRNRVKDKTGLVWA